MNDPTPHDSSYLGHMKWLTSSTKREHASGPEPLSPAAQAVLKSVQATLPDYMLTDKTAGFFAAVALRAVVLQCEYCDDYGTSFIDPKDLLAIATELEGQ